MSYTRLEDFSKYSIWVDPAIWIMREHMKQDGGHDESHLVRVTRHAFMIAYAEPTSDMCNLDIILPSCILHDLVNTPKNNLEVRKQSSISSANLAYELMKDKMLPRDNTSTWTEYTEKVLKGIHHAIHAHSFSANVECTTMEAKIVQDADRLEALGYIGIARLFSVGGSLGRNLFNQTDMIADRRELEEYKYTLDHFYTKLIHIPDQMKTAIGKAKAKVALAQMEKFIEDLRLEVELGTYNKR